MGENFEQSNITPEQRLEAWKNGPTYLASSSSYKKTGLESIGFKNITTISVPDEIEHAEHAEARQSRDAGGASHEDPYFTEIPADVALAKVRYLLEKENISDDSLVCALDTMPMQFKSNIGIKNMSTVWSAHHFNKPKTLEDASGMIMALFEDLIEAHKDYSSMLEKMGSISEDGRMMSERGYLRRLVRVNTGYAVRLPNTQAVEIGSSSVNLSLDEVFKTNSLVQLQAIIDSLIEIQKDNILRIAGGIDYSNPEIRKILGVREVNLGKDSVEEGVYKGFPAEAFDNFLKRLSQK